MTTELPSLMAPFLLSLMAGLSTGIGGLIVILMKRISDRTVSFSLGFASGVMLLVSFHDLFLEASSILPHVQLAVAFSVGAVVMMALDLLLPHIEPVESRESADPPDRDPEPARGTWEDFRPRRRRMRRQRSQQEMRQTGVLIAMGMALHNLPEGVVVAAGHQYLPSLGFVIAIAIALHNIPEGLASAIPLKTSGSSNLRLMGVTLMTGLAEPVGAVLGSILIGLARNLLATGFCLAFAAGIMTYITADELIPVAHEYGHRHTVSMALLLGIIFALFVDAMFATA